MGVPFDTHSAVKRLTNAGFTEPQAEALSDTVHQAVTGGVATKADVEIAKVELEGQIEKAKFDLTWRLVTAIGAINALFLALSRYLPPAG